MPVLIGGVLAAVVAAGAVGIALGARNDGPTPTPFPVPSQQAPRPTGTPAPVVSLAPVPTGGGTAPTARPVTPTPAPNPGGTQVVDVEYISITVPAAWEIDGVEPTYISLLTEAGGIFSMESGYIDGTTTPEDILQRQIEKRQAAVPDLEICRPEQDSTLPNGPAGRSVMLCFTAQTSSGQTFPATVYLQAGVSDGGEVIYLLKIFASDDSWDAVIDEIVPTLDSLQWKLYGG
ncbi:MAG TPA: hypothetical protein VFV66_14325 [Nonomuraea sp.]|nr:hypothetical protein [Nonomuraea sp.]